MTTKTRGGEGESIFYLYLKHTGRCAANSILPLSPPHWFVWAINRPPLLRTSTESICLYPFIHQPACLFSCRIVFPYSLSLSLSVSQNTVSLCFLDSWQTGKATAVTILQRLLNTTTNQITHIPPTPIPMCTQTLHTHTHSRLLLIWNGCCFCFVFCFLGALIFIQTLDGATVMQPPFWHTQIHTHTCTDL